MSSFAVVVLILVGGVAGVLAGLLGVGGGVLLVPAFFYVFQTLGYDGPQLMQVCLATSLATIILTSARSLLSHNRRGVVDWQILLRWAPGIAVGAITGVLVASSLRSTILQGLFGVIGIVIGLYMGLGKAEWRLGHEMPGGFRRVVISTMLGFLSVLMGIGGGSFGVPLMTLYNMAIHRAVAIASGFGILIAVPSVLGFLMMEVDAQSRPPMTIGAVNLVAFFIVISMTLITTPYGVKLAHTMDPKPLKLIFAVFLILVAMNMLRKALGY